MITQADYEMWRAEPMTQEFFRLLQEDIDKVAHGNMTEQHARDHILNASEVGRYEALVTYAEMDYTFFTGIEETG